MLARGLEPLGQVASISLGHGCTHSRFTLRCGMYFRLWYHGVLVRLLGSAAMAVTQFSP